MSEDYLVFDIETTGLNPAFDSIVTCICAKDSDGNIFIDNLASKNEFELITAFLTWLSERVEKYNIMVTCNGLDFDIPFLLLRCMKLGGFPNPIKIFDTFKQFDIQRITFKKISLSDMGVLLKCNYLKKGFGIDAIKLYNEGSYRDLIKYCLGDVELTQEIYIKLR